MLLVTWDEIIDMLNLLGGSIMILSSHDFFHPLVSISALQTCISPV